MTHYPVRDVARDKTREIPPSPVRLLPGSSRLSADRRRGGGHCNLRRGVKREGGRFYPSSGGYSLGKSLGNPTRINCLANA